MMNSPMPRRFALLGASEQSHILENAIRQSEVHHFVEADDSESPGAPVSDELQKPVGDEQWEAVLFSAGREEILESVRQWAQRRKTIIFEADQLLPAGFVAELSLLDAEGTVRIVPFFNWRAFPAVRLMQQIVKTGELGPLLEITIDRFCRRAGQDEPNGLPDATEGMSLLTDVDIVRMLGGDYSQVTLLRSGAVEAGFVQQTLQLAGPDLPPATCTCRISDEFDSVCRVVGTLGTATMKIGPECQLSVDGTARTPTNGHETEIADLSLRVLDESLRGDPMSPQWQDLVRFYEIKAAMDRSLRRRRTIDLHFETASERSQFKTHMATVGCGVILWTMFGIIGLLFAGAVLDPRERVQIDAEAAGFVLTSDDFEPGSDQLTHAASVRLDEIAGQVESSETLVFVAADDADESSPLDKQRLQGVRQRLVEHGVEDADLRTVLRPLKGGWFTRGMQIARVLVFAPVGLYLLFQLLLAVAKPPAKAKPSPGEASDLN